MLYFLTETLQKEQVQIETFGRSLNGQRDILVGIS
ncbi:hypothetical protein CHRYSEOSP005_18000 [Chryseobacterium sp. Alg-005]